MKTAQMSETSSLLESHGSYPENWKTELENTPQYDPNKDKIQNKQSFPQLAEELEPMPEVGDHYIGAEILLSRGDKMARGHVVAHSCDSSEML